MGRKLLAPPPVIVYEKNLIPRFLLFQDFSSGSKTNDKLLEWINIIILTNCLLVLNKTIHNIINLLQI